MDRRTGRNLFRWVNFTWGSGQHPEDRLDDFPRDEAWSTSKRKRAKKPFVKKLFFCKKSSTIPTILETSSNPLTAGTFKDNFPFPKVGYVVPSRLFSMNHPIPSLSTSKALRWVNSASFSTPLRRFMAKTSWVFGRLLLIVYTAENQRMEAKNEGLVQMLFLFLSVYLTRVQKKTAGISTTFVDPKNGWKTIRVFHGALWLGQFTLG